MNSSKFVSQINRNLYHYKNDPTSLVHSRAYTLAKSIRVVVREPQKFVKKTAYLLIKNPKKLAQIALGKRTIRSATQDQIILEKEYHQWLQEQPAIDVEAQKNEAEGFKNKPLVSLITPVFDPPIEQHDKLVESILAQTYPNFELLLFNFGKDPIVRKRLDEWATKDKRVIVKHDLPNQGIADNSNLCLEHCVGEYVGLLDHDDALTPDALYECVRAVNEHDADFIYSDKDKITEDDVRHEPLFKPDWSPEMALGGNYMTHFNLMRTSLVRKLDGWDKATDGAQDWDLFLRILDTTDKVVHVPKILYHWRTVEGSTSTGVGVKPYALAGQRLAVDKHLKRLGLNARAVQDESGQTYVKWTPQSSPRQYIVHVHYGDADQAIKLIKQIQGASWYMSGSQILVLVEKDIIDEKSLAKLTESAAGAELAIYENGKFVSTVTKYIKSSKLQKVVYVSDSTKSVSSALDIHDWAGQLCGWLDTPGVNMAGAASYAVNGHVVDLGSFYDPRSRSFEKYYFSTGFRSGYTGHPQWIRNFVLVSERVFSFNASLAQSEEWHKLVTHKIRDDELAKGLALVNYSQGGRAVYDPLVSSVDRAPFYAVVPSSDTLTKFIDDKCTDLLQADPNYNQNLDRSYTDPKPVFVSAGKSNMTPDQATEDYIVRTIELPR